VSSIIFKVIRNTHPYREYCLRLQLGGEHHTLVVEPAKDRIRKLNSWIWKKNGQFPDELVHRPMVHKLVHKWHHLRKCVRILYYNNDRTILYHKILTHFLKCLTRFRGIHCDSKKSNQKTIRDHTSKVEMVIWWVKSPMLDTPPRDFFSPYVW
jgi:hypothetical protein